MSRAPLIVCEDQDTGDLYLRDPVLYDGTEEGHRRGGVLDDESLWDRYAAACRALGEAKAAVANSLRPVTDADLAMPRRRARPRKAGGK